MSIKKNKHKQIISFQSTLSLSVHLRVFHQHSSLSWKFSLAMSASFHEPRHPSNVTPPHEVSWKSFLACEGFFYQIFQPPCSHVMQQSYQERCSFIKRTSECHSVVHYVDYLNFIFCTIGGHRDNLYLAGLFLIFILCLYLFTILATTADKW